MNLKQFNLEDQKIITALDLGAKAVKCVMGVEDHNKQFKIIGSSELEHNGIQGQQIIDAVNVTTAIRKVCQEVEIISESPITDLWVALSSPFHIFSSEGMAVIAGGQVGRRHIQQSIATALAIPLPDHQEVVHVLPVSFKVDRKDSVFNPVGLSGLRLETSVLLATCDLTSIQDLRRCVSGAGRTARGFVIQSLASGLAVVSHEDKNRGVCVIDMGRHCSQVSIFSGGRCVYLSQFSKGGDDLTGDLVSQLRISPQSAEQLKLQCGVPYEDKGIMQITESLSVSFEDYKRSVCHSLENCFSSIKEDLKMKGFMDSIQNGIILTGGGGLLKNLDQWMRSYFNKPVRRGRLLGVSGSFADNLEYSASMGLLYYAQDDRLDFKEQNKVSAMAWLRDLIS